MASIAFPPRFSISIPVLDASGWDVLTIPFCPLAGSLFSASAQKTIGGRHPNNKIEVKKAQIFLDGIMTPGFERGSEIPHCSYELG